jgi:hypothetical protein
LAQRAFFISARIGIDPVAFARMEGTSPTPKLIEEEHHI